MSGDAWDTPLGQWALAWRDYRRYQAWLDEAAEWRRSTPQPSRAEVIEHVMQRWDGVLRALAESERQDRGELSAASEVIVESADAAFDREIALAHEVCDDAVAADAATAFMPDVPLPFGGEESK